MKFRWSSFRHWLNQWRKHTRSESISVNQLNSALRDGRQQLCELLASPNAPKIALVKQDICEDLYCGPTDASPRQLLESTQLRSGPIALLSAAHARFHVLETVATPECSIWMERAHDLQWESLEFFASYRDRIPGCDYGQKRFALNPEVVDWSQYDLVVSVDVAVPCAVTRRFPRTAWAYYVREVKAPSFQKGLTNPAAGQDLFLNHFFRWRPAPAMNHVVEFPYHLQYAGCFHELFDLPFSHKRHGVFVDHHTLVNMSETDRLRFSPFGTVTGPELPEHLRYEAGKSVPPRRTMDPDLRERLLNSKYFLITPGKRRVHGTALVEAIAAGCLAIGSPTSLGSHAFMFSPRTAAESLDEAYALMNQLQAAPDIYAAELHRQRLLVDWLCFVRPLRALLEKAADVVARRMGN